MIGLSSFFERFRSREFEEMTFRKAVVDAFKEILKFDLDESVFTYSNGTVNLKLSSAAKSAVFLKKNDLLKKINEKTKRKVVDIR
jgi:hypothetical protein